MVKVTRLTAVRTERALTMRELAEKAGVSLNTVYRLEHGEDGHLSTIRKLAETLGVEPPALYGPATAE